MKLSRDQFEQLALEHLDAVDRVARSLTRISAEADDLVQETYLRALRAWETFDLRSWGIRPWLLRILHNLHVTRATREARQPRAMEDAQLQLVPEPAGAGNGLAGADADGSPWAVSEELSQALDQLAPELQTVLTLWAVDELSYKEIAQVLEVPIGTVMSRLHRARQRLRQILSEDGSHETVSRHTRE